MTKGTKARAKTLVPALVPPYKCLFSKKLSKLKARRHELSGFLDLIDSSLLRYAAADETVKVDSGCLPCLCRRKSKLRKVKVEGTNEGTYRRSVVPAKVAPFS